MKNQGSMTQRALLRELRTIVDNDVGLRSLTGSDDRQMPGMIVESMEYDDWASLTFVGELHRIGFRLGGGASGVEAIRGRLDQILIAGDFVLPARIVAEIAATEVIADGFGVTVVVEALTLTE